MVQRLEKMLGFSCFKLKFIVTYSVQINTVPLKSMLPPLRATRIRSRATGIMLRTTKKKTESSLSLESRTSLVF